MERVDCNLCGSAEVVPVMAGRDRVFHPDEAFQVVRCTDCTLAYLNPRPNGEELGKYYPLEYQNGLREYPEDGRRVVKIGGSIWLRRRTPELVPGGKLLDIGCSGGGYLVEMRKLGWDVYGVEMDPDTPRLEKLGLDVRAGTAEVAISEFPDEYFDVVTGWHVLEHVLDPSRVLSEVFRVLKPGGRLMLEVPNFNCVPRLVLRTFWFPLELPRHLYHYTPKTLEKLLEKVGYESITIRGVPAALALTLSMQLIWNRLSGTKGRGMGLNPILLGLFFPFSWLLGKFRWSSHMTADAIKPAFDA